MPFLPGLAVVFAGIAGQSDHRVERQVHAIASELHMPTAHLTATELATVGHHGEGARAIVARLHADGLIAGEYVAGAHGASVRLFIYNGDGGMRSLTEMPLTGGTLGADDLATIRANLADEVAALTPAVTPEVIPAVPAATLAPPPPSPTPVAKLAPSPAPPVETITTGAPTPRPAATPAVATTADTVDVAELEALTSGSADEAPSVETSAPSAPAGETDLHLRATLGLGLATRSFSGPATVPAYASSPVGEVRFAAGVQPTRRLALAGLVERTLSMTSPVGEQMAQTSFSRWQLAADYALVQGPVAVMPLVGVGHRAFAIDSTSPSRSPATEYSYAVLGARAAASLGTRVSVHGHFAFEPVLGGTDPMEMAFGSATRWALDTGLAIEVHPRPHVFARIAADYQRFAWSWNQVGARGAGGAVDSYPSGTLSVGADY